MSIYLPSPNDPFFIKLKEWCKNNPLDITKFNHEKIKPVCSMAGLKHSEESKRKISLALQGKESWIKNKKHTKETIEKMRISNLGEKNGMFGKKHSPETKEKIKIKNLGKKLSVETKEKIASSNKGKKQTQEHKMKIDARSRAIERNKTMLKCPHCQKINNVGNSHRWHFDNCKKL